MSYQASVANDRNLTGLVVAGFKSAINPVQLNLYDITVLAGANSAGKSTVMQPLLLIKQTVEKPFDPGGLAIDGPLARFTHADQFFSHVKLKASSQTFNITMKQDDKHVQLSYGRSTPGGVEIVEMSFGEKDKVHTWTDGQILKESEESLLDASGRSTLQSRLITRLQRSFEIRVARDRAVLVASIVLRDDVANLGGITPIASPAASVVNQVRNMIYLPGLRGNPERNYVISAAGPQYPGSFNDYIASIIHRWGTSQDDQLQFLEDNLKGLGLTWRVTTRAIDDTRVEVRVGRLPNAVRGGARDTVNIADVGFGVSQTLPVLVALLAAAKGQIVFVEQPELHLHPRAQVALVDIILQAADRGVRVIIETHSSLLILALQSAIAEGRLAPDRVSLNWFTRDAAGQTNVIEAKIGDDGSYGDWPEDFGAIELDLQDRYMTLVERRHAHR